MRHSIYGKKLGRSKNQRTALFRSLVRSLILHERIHTTDAKAKAIKGLVDKLVNRAKRSDNASKQVVNSFLTQPDVAKKLYADIALRYKDDRVSGYTSIVRLGKRQGDGAMMVRMSLVEPMKKAEAEKGGRQ